MPRSIDPFLTMNHAAQLIFDMTNDPKYVGGKEKAVEDLSKREVRRTRSILRPLLLHASDISHCFKREDVHLEWSERYFQEYFIEKEMLKSKGVLQSGVRRKEFPKEQIWFFELWGLPFYRMLCQWVDMPDTAYIMKQGEKNHAYWQSGKGVNPFRKVAERNF